MNKLFTILIPFLLLSVCSGKEYIKYFENGQIRSKGVYKNGKREGEHLSYLENGQIKSSIDYKNSKYDGLWIDYYENGTIESKKTYKNSEIYKSVKYNLDGTIYGKFEWKDGKIINSKFY